MIIRKQLQSFLLLIGLLSPALAAPQAYPAKAVAIVLAVPPGGPLDAVARIIAPELTKSLRQSVLVESRPGAGGNIGLAYVAKAPADGHTLLLTASNALTVNRYIYQSLPFDPDNSFAPITIAARINLILAVRSSLNVTNVQEFIALLRARPGKLNFGSAGVGTQTHLAGEIFGIRTATQTYHVPYKGLAQAMSDLVGQQLDFMYDSGASVQHVRTRKLRALAVVGPDRLSVLPDVPSFKEAGVDGMEIANGALAILAPAGTPHETLQRLNADIVHILRMPSIRDRITAVGYVPASSTPDELAAFLREESMRLGEIIKQLPAAR